MSVLLVVSALAGGGVAVAQTIGGPSKAVERSLLGAPDADIPFLPSEELQAQADMAAEAGLPAPSVIEGPLPGDPPDDPDGFKSLYGYAGPAYNPAAQDGGIRVIDETIGEREGPTWHVFGLARNETAQTVGAVKVTARLRSASGEILETVSTTSPVNGVRKGEPVPFELQSATPRTEVAEVDYEAEAAPGPAVDRSFDVQPTATVKYDTQDVSEVYPGQASGERPYPYALDMTVRNRGEEANRVHAVVAWLRHSPDNNDTAIGRVIAMVSVEPSKGEGSDNRRVPDTAPLPPSDVGKSMQYLTADADLGPRLSGAEPIFWSGSVTP